MISCNATFSSGPDDARELFDQMPEKDLVSWNLMIDGYVKMGRMEKAAALFEIMPEKDVISWANLINGYMETGQLNLARQLFDDVPETDLITWNMMLAGYVKNGRFAEALNLFHNMRTQSNLAPDATTLSTALSAISELGRIRDGIAVHEYIKRNHFSLHGKLGVALIDMYAKCGQLKDALLAFEATGTTVDHWNAIIGGLAIHGYGEVALELFHAMDDLLLKPDDITFIGVLNACSHAGLVDEGLKCFDIMKNVCKLKPKVQHYGCMVDILGRLGDWKMRGRWLWKCLCCQMMLFGDLC